MRYLSAVSGFFDRYFSCSSITWKQSRAIVIPLIAEHLFSVMFSLLNTGMISSSGVTSLSAVSLVDSLNSFLFVFYQGMATGGSVIIANYRGRKDADRVHEASVQSVSAVTLFALITSLSMILFHVPLLRLLFGAVEQEIMDKARLYLIGGALTLPLMGFYSAVCGVLRGIGEGKTALKITMCGSVQYVLLNVLFLKILNMGIAGLLFSISLQRILQLGNTLLILKLSRSQFRFRVKEFFRIDFSILKSIVRIGMPCAAENLFFNGGRLVMQVIIVPMGTNAIVTYNIAYAIMLLNQGLTSPVNTAMFTISGICFGSRSVSDARLMTKRFMVLNFFLFILAFGLIQLIFPVLIGFYHAPPETVGLIRTCLLIAGLSHPVLHTLGFTLPSVFRAAGDGLYCTVTILVIMWVVRVFGGLVLGTWCGMGILGVWIAMILDWVVRSVLFPIRFRGDKWLKHKVLSD